MRLWIASYIAFAGRSLFWSWLHRLGGVGLILLGLADNSVVPLPGSMDALTIVLAAHKREWWWYYALMATTGAVIGGYLTYRLALTGGREAFEKKLGDKRAKKVYRTFEKWGFAAVMIPAMTPPPLPIVPFLLAAGAMQYPKKKFLGALAAGRGIRFTVEALVARTYGRAIFKFFGHYYKAALYSLITLAIAGGIAGLFYYLRWKRKKRQQRTKSSQPAVKEQKLA